MSPPYMQCVICRMPGETTTNQLGQRVGSWLIQESLKQADRDLAENEIKKFLRDFISRSEVNLSEDVKKELKNEDIDTISELIREGKEKLNNLIARDASDEKIDLLLAHTIKIKKKLEEVRSNYLAQLESKIGGSMKSDPAEDIQYKVQTELDRAIKNCSPQSDLWVLRDYRMELDDIQAHDKFFIEKYPDYEIIGQQGCGDLTMNLWNVAYVNSPISNNKPVLIHLFEEPLDKRTYSCLVKWKPKSGQSDLPRLTIEDVRFDQYALESNEKVFTATKGEKGDLYWEHRGADIEFAVYGKQVIREGEIVKINRITGEFSDLRHLFLMPNLNPKKKLYVGDKGYPRFYFGKEQHANVWFGEAQLLDHPNEQRAACCGPIFLSRLYRGMGASIEQIRGAMIREKYIEVNEPRDSLSEGQFRFVSDDDSLVEVYLRRNTYGWTIIGLPKDGNKILCLASEGNSDGVTGYKLEGAAQELINNHVYSALLIDEGEDVFQIARLGNNLPIINAFGGGNLDIIVPRSTGNIVLKRNRLRATIIFAEKKNASNGRKKEA